MQIGEPSSVSTFVQLRTPLQYFQAYYVICCLDSTSDPSGSASPESSAVGLDGGSRYVRGELLTDSPIIWRAH
jgi:hypothetical protein